MVGRPASTLLPTPVAAALVGVLLCAGLAGCAKPVTAPIPAGDGRVVYVATGAASRSATATHTAAIATMRPDGTDVRVLASADSAGESVATPAWSGDRSQVVYNRRSAAGEVRVVRADGTGDHRLEFAPPSPGWTPGKPKAMAWSRSGRYLAIAGAPGPSEAGVEQLVVVDLERGESRVLARAAQPDSEFYSLSFSPDDKYLVAGELVLHEPLSEYGAENQGSRLLDVADGHTVRTYPAGMSGLDFSPDGRRLSFVEGQQLRTGTIDLKGRVTVATEQPGMNYGRLVSQDVSYPAVTKWSADGAHLAVNVYKPFATGDPKSTDEGPFLGMYTARGSDFTLPSEYVSDFDW